MGVTRKVAYLGGWPPEGYNEAHDTSILHTWLDRGLTEAEIQAAIEGLRTEVDCGKLEWIKPKGKFTLRALVNTKSKEGVRLWDVALGAGLKVKGPMPESLRDALRKAIG
jgi:hypothetical protein